jgi:DNA-binding transcriptional ArsR family regulator
MKREPFIFVKAISEPTRLRILSYLKKECCVGELWKKLDLPQNLTSHHLRILRESKLIISEKRGLKVVYRLNEPVLRANFKKLKDYLL